MTAMFAEMPHQQHPHHLQSSIYSPQPYLSAAGQSQFFLDDFPSPIKKSNPFFDIGSARPFPRQSQYALPVQSHRQADGGGQNAKTVSQSLRAEMGEHMLRRKTPNGTLSAGYDGTPVDWSSRPHADKHFLISAADTARYATQQAPAFASPNALSSYDGQVMLNQPDNLGSTYWHAQSSQPQPRYGMGNDTITPSQIWLQNTSRQPLDSMLYQVPQTPLSFMNSLGHQQVPTVLQPMWPPTIGLTSSNAQGRFGPYWPDGSFEPYVPAPFRDGQLPPHLHYNNNFNGQLETYSRQQSASNSPFVTPNENDFVFWNGQGFQDNRRHSGTALPSPYPGGLRSSYDGGQPLPRQQTDPNPSFAHRARAMSAKFQRHGSDATVWPQMPNSGQLAQLALRTPSSPNNPHFKTRVLIWAHRVYINLIQHSRRQNQARSSSDKTQSIFPKPPRQSYTSSRDGSTFQMQSQQTSSGLVKPEALDSSASRSIQQGIDAAGAAQWNNGNQRSSFHEKHDRGLRLNQPMQNNFRLNGVDPRQAATFISNPSPISTPILASPQQAVREAQHALEILETLCQESSWQWVDGTLLGGCLAYGLEQFQAALGWYERVLACDPNNVEAISNTAAAFLSLKRRKEAEQYWFRAVKLRPTYFEAVEHLVGLLCSDQRGREAVKIIEYVENSLRLPGDVQKHLSWDQVDGHVNDKDDRTPFSADKGLMGLSLSTDTSSGYRILPQENGRLLALIHAKGNMLYALGDNAGAAKAFEDAIMIGCGRRSEGIGGLIRHILRVFAQFILSQRMDTIAPLAPYETILLMPNVALKTAELVFPDNGQLPGLREVPEGQSRKAAVSVASNSLLSLAKIYQDGMSSNGAGAQATKSAPGVQDILALYYLSLSLSPSPSTANNVGILLASVQQTVPQRTLYGSKEPTSPVIPGVVPGSGIALALAYYNYGLNLDNRHAHLFTNLGSLLKDIGQLGAAIKMYEQAVSCDGNFDIALANLANAVKDQGRISDAIGYYRRAVKSSPDFAEAVCGLANALNSVCSWMGRGGIVFADKKYDRWHVDEEGMLVDARELGASTSGWIGRVVAIVEKQLRDGKSWGKGILQSKDAQDLLSRNNLVGNMQSVDAQTQAFVVEAASSWSGEDWEGAKIVRLVERATRQLGWQMYQEKHVLKLPSPTTFARPQLPSSLSVPSAPTVLPFHTFTCPLTANQIRKISQRNGLRISCSTLKAPWLPSVIFEPPNPPQPFLKVGYVSSDFNNHPLAHLMQSVFGFHDPSRVKAICYATTASDKSTHREQIQREAPVFHDASSWSVDRLVKQIVSDGIHILINLNGYTRGARNEVFAARPAPIQMSFMGFAGTLGAEWCDYLLADSIAVPPSMLRPWRGNVDLIDQAKDNNYSEDDSDWVYGENIIFAKETFFCCDHRQSAPDAKEQQLTWEEEQERRKKMRKELFPNLPADTVILGNFNQLYKIEPTTFRTWLRILQAIPKAVLWLLRFPELGEANLREIASQWATESVAKRIIFTDVAPKNQHIARARVCDLFLDTPECNAHTTAADVLWSGTPLLTLPRYEYKMCSRMAASILRGALPRGPIGDRAARELTTLNDEEYEARASELGNGLAAVLSGEQGNCRLLQLRQMLYEGRWSSALFDTRRWVSDLEDAYEEAWRKWVAGEGGDIWLKDIITT